MITTTKRLPMTNQEIVTSYREAKDKKMQVKILSELNVCSKEKIKEILITEGVRQCELPRNRKKKEDEEVKKFNLREQDPKTEASDELEEAFEESADQLDPLVRQALLCYREKLKTEREQEQHSLELARQLVSEHEASLKLLQEALRKIDRMTAEDGDGS